MASMRELFPLHNYHKKFCRNFVEENIRNVKACSQQTVQKKNLESISNKKSENTRTPVLSKISSTELDKKTTIWNNVKLKKPSIRNSRVETKYGSSNLTNKNERGSQTDLNQNEDDRSKSCQNCNPSLVSKSRLSPRISKSESNITSEFVKMSNAKETLPDQKTRDSHQLSHENENAKKDPLSKNQPNPETYKMGEVPRYLQERKAKLIKDQEEKKRREKLEEIMGLKDPRCPPGHMLMPPDELQRNLTEMETAFEYLIQELNRMPVSNDSFRIRQRRIHIEKELNVLEQKLELFRTKKVFVKIPD